MSKRAISISEFLDKYYKKVGNKTIPVPIKEVLQGTLQYDWFKVPDRGRYVETLSNLLDNFLQEEGYKEFRDYSHLTEAQFLMRIEGKVGVEEHQKSWKLLMSVYAIFKNKVYDILVENGIVDSHQEADTYRSFYEPYLQSKEMPRIPDSDTKEKIITFFIIYLVFLSNFIDIFGFYLIACIKYLEHKEYALINEGIVLGGDISERILHILSSEDMYIITEIEGGLGVPKDLESVNEVMRILRELEEDYSPPVMTMVNYNMREELTLGFLTKLVTDDNNARNDTLHKAFVLMRQGVGDKVVERFKTTPLAQKSFVRGALEGILIEWWEMYKADSLISLPIVQQRINHVKQEIQKNNWKVDLVVDGLVSPSKFRVTFLNNEPDVGNLNKATQLFLSQTSYKAKEPKHLSYNKLKIQNNLVKIYDVRVHP